MADSSKVSFSCRVDWELVKSIDLIKLSLQGVIIAG